jgi:esterase/lipase superfamily enzyme
MVIERHRKILPLTCALLLAAVSGCSNAVELMPTPNLYANGYVEPFPNVPAEFQNNRVDVLYLTDRLPEAKDAESPYGYGRSRSVAFGVSEVQFGKDVSWAELNKVSHTSKRPVKLEVTVTKTKELLRFPQTPRSLLPTPGQATRPATQEAIASTPYFHMLGDDDSPDELAARAAFTAELSARLARTPKKEVYLFVHGYNNNFYDAVETIAQLWHFLGREGVPIAYTWPAGSKGLLRGYTYDRESSEFTVYHLKQMLRLIASCPDVQKVNVIAHRVHITATFDTHRPKPRQGPEC